MAGQGVSGQSVTFESGVYIGSEAGKVLSTGDGNVLVGYHTGLALTTGASNVVIGTNALDVATTATQNVAIGADAMGAVPAGQAVAGCVAIGLNAMLGSGSTTTGADDSVAIG